MPREFFSTDALLSAAGSAAHHYPVAVRASAPHSEVLAKDWAEDWPEDLSDSASEIEARPEARVDGGGSRAPFLTVVESDDGGLKTRNPQNAERVEKQSAIRNPRVPIRRRPGLKKLTKRQMLQDWPPAPRGCEWRRSDDGLNLWRCWTEWDEDKTRKIRKSRYAGHLSDDAWRIMKEYDHEAFISAVGERLRRHSGR